MRRALIASALLLSPALAQNAKLPPITKVGTVTLAQSTMGMPDGTAHSSTSASASFHKALGGEGAALPSDTCTVFAYKTGDTSGIPGVKEAAAQAARIVSLDAGDPLPMTGAGQVYAKLPLTVRGKQITYSPEDPALPVAPAKLVIDIPVAGGEGGFPAFKNAALPSAARVKLTAPTDTAAVTPTTAFAWSNPTNDAGARVTLTGSQQVGDKTVAFSCQAKDDGAFAFPAATQKDLAAKGWTKGPLSMYGRTATRSLRSGGALLNLSVVVYEMPTRR